MMSTAKTLFSPDLANMVETMCAKAAQAALDAATVTAATLKANVPELQGRTNGEILETMDALRERNPDRFNAVFDQIQRVNSFLALKMLAMHCVELSLKAALMHSGITADELRKQYGHNLKGLFEASATFLDWSDFNLPDIEFYSDAVSSQALRYRTKAHFFVERNHILAFAEKTFHRCLQYVFPGAKRTLRI